MFNKICFYIFLFVSVITLGLSFFRVILRIDIIKSIPITNSLLIYSQNLSTFSKVSILLFAIIIIAILLKGFIGYINTLKSK